MNQAALVATALGRVCQIPAPSDKVSPSTCDTEGTDHSSKENTFFLLPTLSGLGSHHHITMFVPFQLVFFHDLQQFDIVGK